MTDPYRALRVYAESLADMQTVRIRVGNRSGGYMRDPSNVGITEHDRMQAFTDVFEQAEKVVRESLILEYQRVVPEKVQQWVIDTPGLGESTMARLIGTIGDPRIAHPKHWEVTGKAKKTKAPEDGESRALDDRARVLVEDPPYERTVGQLWSYCGIGDPARKKVKGMSQEDAFKLGNPKAKMLLYLIAESIVKVGKGPYRKVYDETKEGYQGHVHSVVCVRCGPSGKPAQVGNPWSKGHIHAASMRKVSKEVLRDLWVMTG